MRTSVSLAAFDSETIDSGFAFLRFVRYFLFVLGNFIIELHLIVQCVYLKGVQASRMFLSFLRTMFQTRFDFRTRNVVRSQRSICHGNNLISDMPADRSFPLRSILLAVRRKKKKKKIDDKLFSERTHTRQILRCQNSWCNYLVRAKTGYRE